MLTTVNLPDALFLESQQLAASRGATIEQLIVESIAKYVRGVSEPPEKPSKRGHTKLPVLRSRRPGTLDLSNFDFDDLLT